MRRATEQTIVHSLLEPFPGRPESSHAAGFLGSVSAAQLLEAAGLTRRAAVFSLVSVAALSLAASLAGGALVGVLMLGVSGMLATFVARRRAARRSQELERDLPALLTAIASSVRAGVDPVSAMLHSRKFFRPETLIASELQAFEQRLKSGEGEEAALQSFMNELSSTDLELFKRCMSLSRRHGASLAEPLHRVVRVVRQRQSFRRKTRGALAMHRMSAIGIALCAGVIGAIQFGMNSAGVRLAWAHPAGWKLLTAGGCLMGVGIVWMMALGREERL